MSNFHRPRVYRSASGCCICGAKSSSSRFTSSDRYEQAFGGCFGLPSSARLRSGDICNACVLLVKRWKKLPSGSTRNWKHVVDARVGGGCRLPTSRSKKQSPNKLALNQSSGCSNFDNNINWPDNVSVPSPCDNEVYSSDEETDDISSRPTYEKNSSSATLSSFLDSTYWKQTKVCCGIIYRGANSEVLLDMRLWRPCLTCRHHSNMDNTAASSCEDNSSSSSLEFDENHRDLYCIASKKKDISFQKSSLLRSLNGGIATPADCLVRNRSYLPTEL